MKVNYVQYEIALVGCVMIVLIGIASCKDTSNPITKIDEIVFPDSNISYNKQVQPLFNVGCVFAGCHDRAREGNEENGGNYNLDLTYYAGLWNGKPGVVNAGDTTNSRLVWSIEWRPGPKPMPPSKRLSENQTRGLKRWILEGAKETP